MIGSMAALASWNSKMQPANISSRRSHQYAPQAGGRRPLAGVRGTFDVAHANAAERQDRWRSKDGGQEEHSLTGDKGSACTHRSRSNAVADRGEAGIAAQPRAECSMADKAQADRGDAPAPARSLPPRGGYGLPSRPRNSARSRAQARSDKSPPPRVPPPAAPSVPHRPAHRRASGRPRRQALPRSGPARYRTAPIDARSDQIATKGPNPV